MDIQTGAGATMYISDVQFLAIMECTRAIVTEQGVKEGGNVVWRMSRLSNLAYTLNITVWQLKCIINHAMRTDYMFR